MTRRSPFSRLSGERVFYTASASEAIPDGMALDRNGHVWLARWDGFSIVHHAEDGSVLGTISFPVAKVSSLCLGEPALNQMFITTAGGTPNSTTADGGIYQPSPGVLGLPEFRSRITC